MPDLIVLVGLPGSGKSTWVGNQVVPSFIYSTDDYIMGHVGENGYKSYNEAFPHCIDSATKAMENGLKWAISRGEEIIWDQTNMSPKKRRSIVSKVPANYRKNCYCIIPPRNEAEWAELKRRLASRPGKNIPDSVVQSMASSYVEPSLSEGFDRVMVVDMYGNILKDESV